MALFEFINMFKLPKLAVAAVALLAFYGIAQANDADDLQSYLDKTATVKANFEQTITNEYGDTVSQQNGSMAVSRPGKFRWDYDGLAPQSIASDGQKMWLYDVELKQVTIRPIDSALAASPAALLTGSVNINEEYTVQEVAVDNDVRWLRITPKNNIEDIDYQDILLGFRGGELKAMRLVDSFSQITDIQFTNIEINPALNESLFEMKVPDDVDVVGG